MKYRYITNLTFHTVLNPHPVECTCKVCTFYKSILNQPEFLFSCAMLANGRILRYFLFVSWQRQVFQLVEISLLNTFTRVCSVLLLSNTQQQVQVLHQGSTPSSNNTCSRVKLPDTAWIFRAGFTPMKQVVPSIISYQGSTVISSLAYVAFDLIYCPYIPETRYQSLLCKR